jgi:hypothetical protein
MKSFNAFLHHEGEPPFVWVAEIKHTQKDGRHVFTSDKIHGLLVVSKDLDKAIKQLRFVIPELVKRNHGFDCSVWLGGHQTPGSVIDQPDVAVITRKDAA